MRYETLHYAVQDDVATIAMARPETRNALTAQMRVDLAHAVARAGDEARVAVLTGAGDAFCAGHELGDAANLRDLDLGRTMREETRPLLEALDACAAPLIAAVNGQAAGAGLALALAADICVARESASFAATGVRLGLAPDGGLSWRLPRLLGPARARGFAMLGESITAAQAAEWGLIWDCVADDRFEARVGQLARRLARGPTVGYRLTREALNAGLDAEWPAQLETEAKLQSRGGASRDFLEAMLARAENRPPVFEGR